MIKNPRTDRLLERFSGWTAHESRFLHQPEISSLIREVPKGKRRLRSSLTLNPFSFRSLTWKDVYWHSYPQVKEIKESSSARSRIHNAQDLGIHRFVLFLMGIVNVSSSQRK